MTDERALGPRFWRLAIPMVLANITVPLAGLVDAAMLGHLDTATHLAGVALGAIVFDYLFWSFGFLRMGTTGLTSQAVGRDDALESTRIGLRALVTGVGAGCLLVVMGPVVGWLAFGLLEGEADVLRCGRAYFDWRLLGAPAALANFALTGWLLGVERSRAVLAMAVLTNVANIVLDWVFIVRLGWASAGAGAATMLAQWLAFGLGLFLVAKPLLGQWATVRSGIWDRSALGSWMALNRDITIRTLALVSAFSIFTDFSAVLGTTLLASNTLMLKVISVAAWFIDGFAFAVETLVGRFQGTGDRKSAKRLLRLGLGAALVVGLVTATAFNVWPKGLFGLLTDQVPLLDQLGLDAPVLFVVLGFGSVAYILDGWFLGISSGAVLRRTMMVSLLVGFLPLAIVARWMSSSTLLWAAMACFMAFRVVTLGREVPASLRRIGSE